jgi:hypothetical protein
LELHGRRHGDSPKRGERGKEEGERGARLGVRLGEGAPWEGAEELSHATLVALYMWRCSSVLYTRESRRRKEKGEEKEKEGKQKEKKKKYGKFSKLENFQKINIIYEVGQKIFLYKKDICRIINK